MKPIYFITGNNGKFFEAQKKFSEFEIKILQKDIGYPEIQAETLEEVALYGIDNISNRFNQPFFLEDAGLFVDILKGFPGVYSKYVYYTIGLKGVLKLLKDVKMEDRTATFKSVIGYFNSENEPRLFIGECKGLISLEKIGKHGFGYDPIFIPQNEKKTFAEMETSEKNIFSHRGKSLIKFIDYFKNKQIENFKS